MMIRSNVLPLALALVLCMPTAIASPKQNYKRPLGRDLCTTDLLGELGLAVASYVLTKQEAADITSRLCGKEYKPTITTNDNNNRTNNPDPQLRP